MVLRVKPIAEDEARNLAETAALVARAEDLAVIRVTGKDRLSWLAGLVTQDVAKLAPGAAAYTFLCEKKGKIVCDMHVIVRAEALLLLVPAEARDATFALLDHHLIMEDVELAPTDDAVFRVYGPRAETLALALAGAPWKGAPARVAVAHVVAEGDIDAFAERLADAAREHGAAVAPPRVEEDLRIAFGIPRFGKDFGPAHYPQESSLHGLGVSFSKGCYLGQEVLYMLEHRGHAKRHVVRLSSEAELAPGAVLHDGDAEVGAISSVARAGAGSVALGMVKAAASKEGHALRAGDVSCIVHTIG